MPWLDLYAGEPDADEPSLTAIAELALLSDLIRRARRPAPLEAFAEELGDWLRGQAGHPSVRRLVSDGPALALSAPLMLRVALGEDVEDVLPARVLAEACARLDLSGAPMTHWRRLETAALTRRLDIRFSLAGVRERPLLTGPLSAVREVADLYRVTHEVFHVSDFGARTLGVRTGASALRKCRAGLGWALANRHVDLTAEFIAALNCLGGDEVLRARAWIALSETLSGTTGATIADRAEAISQYHPYVATLLAAVTPVIAER